MLIDTTPRLARRLDAVVDGVLEQRLQHERRHQRVARHAVQVPLDLQAVAQPQLLELEVLAAQLDLVGERRELAVVAHQHAKQVGHVLQRRFRRASGRVRTSDSTALMLLNRKCGRMRACSACSRASVIAGDSALARSRK